MDFFIDPFFYNWLILGAILLIVEVASFTLLFFWLAIAAVIMAAISYLVPSLSLTAQLLIFAIIAVLSVIIWHRVFKKTQDSMGDAKMNNRASRYVGQTATLVEPITNGLGKIQIEDSFWRVSCTTDLPAGSQVKIVDSQDVTLIVQPK